MVIESSKLYYSCSHAICGLTTIIVCAKPFLFREHRVSEHIMCSSTQCIHTLSLSQSATKSSNGSTRRRLQFKNVLNKMTRKSPASSASNNGSDKSSSQQSSSRSNAFINKVFHIPRLSRQSKDLETGVDSRVKTASGQYSVAPRDASVLERISHKAQNRARRVRKAHEVRKDYNCASMYPLGIISR